MNPATTLLGFDVGARRIGVAVGNTFSGTASEVGVLMVHAGGPEWPQLDRWIGQWRPQALVVGDPLTMDGEPQEASRRAREFGRSVAERYHLPVHAIDERLSSIEAARRFAQARAEGGKRRKHAANLDAGAAVVILERWLAAQATNREGEESHEE
jgi:putative Holliday junction resolvase